MARRHWDFLTGDREKDQRNVEVLLESVEEMYARHSAEDRIRSAVDRALLVTGAEVGILLLPDEAGMLRPHVARGSDGALPLSEPYSSTVVDRVWGTGRPFVMEDFAESSAMGDLGASIPHMRLLSVMGVALPVEGRSVGVLYVHSTKAVRSFGDSDLSVLQALGGMIGQALAAARSRAAEEEKQRMIRELKLAQRVQQGFLPEVLPQPPGFDVAGIGLPCEETSGDYYDVVPLADGQFAFVVGDVSGHGLAPALVMASTRALLHGILASTVDPVAAMVHANQFLERDTRDEVFMTMVIACLDPATGTLRYVSAGHGPLLRFTAGAAVEELVGRGTALGITADARYEAADTGALGSGGALMLYTDGIYEARNEEDELYGEERVHASFGRHAAAAGSAQEILDRVLEDLRQFVGTRRLDDDVTCVVLRAD